MSRPWSIFAISRGLTPISALQKRPSDASNFTATQGPVRGTCGGCAMKTRCTQSSARILTRLLCFGQAGSGRQIRRFQLERLLGKAANTGRDKMTIFTSPEIYDLGAWMEQLVANRPASRARESPRWTAKPSRARTLWQRPHLRVLRYAGHKIASLGRPGCGDRRPPAIRVTHRD